MPFTEKFENVIELPTTTFQWTTETQNSSYLQPSSHLPSKTTIKVFEYQTLIYLQFVVREWS